MRSRFLLIAVTLCSVLLFRTRSARAWSIDGLITEEATIHVSWLDQYHNILVTPLATPDPTLSTASFQINYMDAGLGQHTTARDILAQYVDEPDWGMDDHLNLSPFQALIGGSQAYRHDQYQFIHGLVRVGVAQARAAHFYRLSLQAFRKGDPYWGFRQLARCLHYVEDLGQPFHDHPFTWGDLWLARWNPRGLPILSTNLKLAYQAYVAQKLHDELQHGGGYFVNALRDEPPAHLMSLGTGTEALGDFGYQNAHALINASNHFWGRRILSTHHLVLPTAQEIRGPHDPAAQDKIDDITIASLQATSRIVQGILELAHRQGIAPSGHH